LTARLAAFALFVGLVSASFRARACTCETITAGRRLEMADAAFAGEVVEVLDRVRGNHRPGDAERAARIRVIESFKGVREGATELVFTGYGAGDCGVEFTPGERYVIAATGPGHWFTSVCSSSLERKAPELRSEMRATAHLPSPENPSRPLADAHFCARPGSWRQAIDAVDVAFTGRAISACPAWGGGFTWRVAVIRAVKGVEPGAILDFDATGSFRWREPWFLLVRHNDRLVRDPCATLAESTIDSEVERTQVENETEDDAPPEGEGAEEQEETVDAGAAPPVNAEDPRTWQTPCGTLTDIVFGGERPSGMKREQATPSNRGRGCAGCTLSTRDENTGSSLLLLTLAALATYRARRALSRRTCELVASGNL
jgi:hypothetical protein